MIGKKEIPTEVKIQAVEDYLAVRKGSTQITAELKVRMSTFQSWLRKYEMSGAAGLYPRDRNANYPSELKLEAVRDYLSGGGSLATMCRKYGIASHSILQQWITLYNKGHEDFKSRMMREEAGMTKGRKASYEEKVQATIFCLEHESDYQLTSERFVVSYQQIYAWVQKYKERGESGLVDQRGKRKQFAEQSDAEKAAAHVRKLEAENQRLKMENDFLKKLDQLERGCSQAEFTKDQSMKPSKCWGRKKDTR